MQLFKFSNSNLNIIHSNSVSGGTYFSKQFFLTLFKLDVHVTNQHFRDVTSSSPIDLCLICVCGWLDCRVEASSLHFAGCHLGIFLLFIIIYSFICIRVAAALPCKVPSHQEGRDKQSVTYTLTSILGSASCPGTLCYNLPASSNWGFTNRHLLLKH